MVALMACASASEAQEPEAVADAGLAHAFNRHLMQGTPVISWKSEDCTKPTYTGEKDTDGSDFFTCPKGRTTACCFVNNRCTRNADGDEASCDREKGAEPACCPWTGL